MSWACRVRLVRQAANRKKILAVVGSIPVLRTITAILETTTAYPHTIAATQWAPLRRLGPYPPPTTFDRPQTAPSPFSTPGWRVSRTTAAVGSTSTRSPARCVAIHHRRRPPLRPAWPTASRTALHPRGDPVCRQWRRPHFRSRGLHAGHPCAIRKSTGRIAYAPHSHPSTTRLRNRPLATLSRRCGITSTTCTRRP